MVKRARMLHGSVNKNKERRHGPKAQHYTRLLTRSPVGIRSDCPPKLGCHDQRDLIPEPRGHER